MEAVRDYLVGSGYVLVNRPLSSTIDAAVLSEAMGQALQHVPLEDVYDIPPISRVWKFQRNGRMVDLIGCRYEVRMHDFMTHHLTILIDNAANFRHPPLLLHSYHECLDREGIDMLRTSPHVREANYGL